MRSSKEDDKTPVKVIDSSVENCWSWKGPDERLEHSFKNVVPIKYKIRDCIKEKLTFLGLHGIGLCGVETKSTMQIMAKKKL